jgi:hypothetical protein
MGVGLMVMTTLAASKPLPQKNDGPSLPAASLWVERQWRKRRNVEEVAATIRRPVEAPLPSRFERGWG